MVRAGDDSRGQRPPAATTLAWARLAPDQAAASARPSMPVVRERVSPHGAWWPGQPAAQRPAQLPAGIAPPAPPRTVADLARPAALASGMRDPAGPAAARVPPEQPPGRRADPAGRERETTRQEPPRLDMDRIVSTVQRRLTHQMAIERERRGMTR